MAGGAPNQIAAHDHLQWHAQGQQAVLHTLLKRMSLPPDARLLQAGCGVGEHLGLLAAFGHVDAFDHDTDARTVASRRGVTNVSPGSLPHDIPPGGPYDLIALLDLLPFLETEAASIGALAKRLRRGGKLLITVPTDPRFRRSETEEPREFRLYTKTSLEAAVQTAGMEVDQIGRMNAALAPVLAAGRLWSTLRGSGAATGDVRRPWLNNVLQTLATSERHLVGRVPIPFGLSLWAIATAPERTRLDVRA